MNCAVCGTNTDCECTYLLPLSFIEDCNYHRINADSEIISLIGNPTKYGYQNRVYLCSKCASRHNSNVIIPSPRNVLLKLQKYNEDIILGYMNFVYNNRVPIYLYLSERCVAMDNSKGLFITNMQSMLLIKDLKELIKYVESKESTL